MIYLQNTTESQEISVPRSFGVIAPVRKNYLTDGDIADNLLTDNNKKVLSARQGVVLKGMIDDKADSSDVYSKTEVDSLLDDKADSSDVYNKTEVDELLDDKVDTDDLKPVATSGSYNDLTDKPTIPAQQLFIAEYGVTTYDEIIQAYTGGKGVVVMRNNALYVISNNFGGYIYFGCPYSNNVRYLRVSSQNEWIEGILNLEQTSNKAQTITGNETNTTKYPTTKAVYDAIIAAKEIFWAEYGETRASEIIQALDAGKIVLVTYSGNVAAYSMRNDSLIRFTSIAAGSMNGMRVDVNIETDAWSIYYSQYEKISNKSQDISTDRASTTKYPSVKAVFDSLGKWGVISQTQTWTQAADNSYSYEMSNLVYGLIPQANIDMYEDAGAVFNETTGYFEMNGLTDLSYKEIQLAYRFAYGCNGKWTTIYGNIELQNARTTFPLSIGTLSNSAVNRSFYYDLFYFTTMLNMEVLRLTQIPERQLVLSPNSGYFFYSGRNPLRKVIGALNVFNCGSSSWLQTYFFTAAYDLEEIYLQELKGNIRLKAQSKLTLASVVFAVQHSANGSTAITITLHANAYARCQADTTEYTYNGNTYTGILALATAKNISIVSA